MPDASVRVIQPIGHEGHRFREMMFANFTDAVVLAFAHSCVADLVLCHRADFVALAKAQPHSGIVIWIRRAMWVSECRRFLQAAAENGLQNNRNFA